MRGGVVASILVLVVLIVITPVLLGRPPSELASVPLLIIGMSEDKSDFIVNLGAAVNAYQYDLIRLTIFNSSDPSVNGTFSETEAYSLYRWVPGNVTFSVNAYFVDRRGNYFEYNVTTRAADEDNRTVMVITFPDERDNVGTEIRQVPPDDYRKAIPRRGSLP